MSNRMDRQQITWLSWRNERLIFKSLEMGKGHRWSPTILTSGRVGPYRIWHIGMGQALLRLVAVSGWVFFSLCFLSAFSLPLFVRQLDIVRNTVSCAVKLILTYWIKKKKKKIYFVQYSNDWKKNISGTLYID